MTIISMLHVISFSFSWATLAVSVLSVSLYGVKTSTGVMSEHELVSAFVKADHDHSGVLDKKEVEEAVKKWDCLRPSFSNSERNLIRSTVRA